MNNLKVLDFWAPWCGPCKMLSSVIDELIKVNPEVTFEKVNVDESTNSDLVYKYQLSSVPTLLILKEDKEVSRITGFKNKDYIQSIINDYK